MVNNQEKYNLFSRGKKIAEVFFKLGNIKNINSKTKFIDLLVEECSIQNYIRIMGFKNINEFKDFLAFIIFGKGNHINKTYLKTDKKLILIILSEALESCISLFDKKVVKIFIFPTFDNFVIKRMNGVSGFCTNRNVILVCLAPVGMWKSALKSAIVHELSHALSPYYDMSKISIGEGFIFDGIAENLREHFIGGEKAEWVKKFSKQEAMRIFNELKPYLDVDDINFYREVFFGTGKYPLWVGYAIGYYLFEAYLKTEKSINWKEIINTPPKKILDEIIKSKRSKV